MEWDPTVDPTQRGYNRYEVDAHLERFDAEIKRLTTQRDESITHAEDLGYQVEVLRAKLHDLRRQLAVPRFDSIGGQAEQLLRSAQQQAEAVRSDAERQVAQSRAETQRIYREATDRSARMDSECCDGGRHESQR